MHFEINSLKDYIDSLDMGWAFALGHIGDAFRILTPNEMKAHERTDDAKRITQTWRGHAEFGSNFTVTTIWETADDGRFVGRIHFENFNCATDPKLYIEQLRFPYFHAYFGKDSRFHLTGRMYDSKIVRPGQELDHPIRSIQFCAIINPDAQSVYLDWRDPEWNTKDVLTTKDMTEDSLVCASKYIMPLDDVPAANGGVPYECSVKFYQGSWFEATQFYKPWALKQTWWTNRPEDNPLAGIDLWVWNRGKIEDVIPPVERLNADLPECKIALDWYWWHHNPYDTDYPNFWPPREGETAFKEAVRRMSEQGIHSQVYVNGVCWDHDTANWNEGGEDEVRIQRDGKPKETAFNCYNHHRLAWMCGTAKVFQQKIFELVTKLHDSGLTSQYLDQIGCSTFWPCYNRKHHHPMGGGHYHVEGVRKQFQRLRETFPDFPLTSETGSEPYMDLVDGGIICETTSGERMSSGATELVPSFQAVYHGRYVTFGNYALPDGIPPWDPLWPDEDRWQDEKPWHLLFPEQFYVEMARTVVFGAQPMVCNLKKHIYEDPTYAEEYAFILKTARFYAANKDCLYAGDMMSPNGFECARKEMNFHARMIFTKPSTARIVTKTLPCVLHGFWKNKAGQCALFMANVTQTEQPWAFKDKSGTIPPRSYLRVDF